MSSRGAKRAKIFALVLRRDINIKEIQNRTAQNATHIKYDDVYNTESANYSLALRLMPPWLRVSGGMTMPKLFFHLDPDPSPPAPVGPPPGAAAPGDGVGMGRGTSVIMEVAALDPPSSSVDPPASFGWSSAILLAFFLRGRAAALLAHQQNTESKDSNGPLLSNMVSITFVRISLSGTTRTGEWPGWLGTNRTGWYKK